MDYKVAHTDVNLFQLADSSFPIGGFVYSLGMESAIKHGVLKNNDDVLRYLKTYLNQIFSFDFPFFDAGYTYLNQPDEWDKISIMYDVMLNNPSIYKSSIVLGKNWMKLVISLYRSEKLSELDNHFKQNKLPFHQVVLLGLGYAALGVNPTAMKEMYIYTAMRDQISALTRLGTIGPQGGQSLLTVLLQEGNSKLKSYEPTHYEQATKSAYLLEILQLNHDKIYSKLFQN